MSDARRTKITQTALGPSSPLTRLDTSTCRLVVVNTLSKGASFDLEGTDTIVIGADEDCQLRVQDPTVSGQHARVTRSEGGALVTDLGSTNGTFYQRSRVREVVVPYGATIGVGKAHIKVIPHEKSVNATPSTVERFGDLVGDDQRMREMFSLLGDVAPTEATVVVEGETGTGKELVAKALHDKSARAGKSFVVFDCSAVPHDLVESALFGHTKGAFTGATGTRQGAFRRANGGTIFLDEIGELPLDLQPKLLRAIESRTVQQVGGDDYERVDVRVIAATNRNLKSEVRAGRFREDLYYRLAVVRIVLPPLRERLDDLKVLVEHFLGTDSGVIIDPASIDKMRDYSWPGNVRELKNVVERTRSLSRGGVVDISKYLPGQNAYDTMLSGEGDAAASEKGTALASELTQALDPESGLSFKDAKAQVVTAFENRFLSQLIERSEGNISRAAQAASMDRKHLRELLKRYGLWNG